MMKFDAQIAICVGLSKCPRLAELFYVLDEEDGIISQQRAAQLLAVPPACGEAGRRMTCEINM